MESINLNINEYTQKELEDILSLEYPYTQTDINESTNSLMKNLSKDDGLDGATRARIKEFVNAAANQLSKIITKGITGVSLIKEEEKHFSNMTSDLYQFNDQFVIKNAKRRAEAYQIPSYRGLNIGDDGGAPPGIINPIKYTTIKRALNIDSRFRPNYYSTSSSDQQLVLPYKFENVINMRLASIEIPLSYYAVSQTYGNNTFILGWNFTNPISGKESEVPQHIGRIRLPDGNYETLINAQTGASNIESVMNACLRNPNMELIHGSTTMIADPSFSLAFTVDHTSGRSIFAIDPSGITDFAGVMAGDPNLLRFKMYFGIDSGITNEDFAQGNANQAPLPYYLGWQLGYRANLYDSGPRNGNNVPCAMVSEGLCYIKGPQYLFVSIDDYNNNVNNYYISAYTDSINSRNILARINLASIQQQNGVYQTGEDDGFSTQINRSRNYFGPVNIERIRITLLDEYGRVINLNNMDWSCALMFEQMYEGGNL